MNTPIPVPCMTSSESQQHFLEQLVSWGGFFLLLLRAGIEELVYPVILACNSHNPFLGVVRCHKNTVLYHPDRLV